MGRRSRQSELLERNERTTFRPTTTWSRLSFLDLIGEGSRPPIELLEPAYIDGSTLVAVWPDHGDLDAVVVATWAPDARTLTQLQELQAVDWPPGLCDVSVRIDESGRTRYQPWFRCRARQAMQSKTEMAARVRHALEQGARMLGRTLNLAA